jgi:hypothetical protein
VPFLHIERQSQKADLRLSIRPSGGLMVSANLSEEVCDMRGTLAQIHGRRGVVSGTWPVLLLYTLACRPLLADQRRTVLIDIPGVNWTGELRPSHWGNLLPDDRMTIYVRHEGPGRDNWANPPEKGAVVVTMPHQWNRNVADQLLRPVIQRAFSQGNKSVHIVVDMNITLPRHVTIAKKKEDQWAAKLTDYLTEHKPKDSHAILAQHSHGTVVNAHITNFQAFDQVIISSPRGDQALEFIGQTENLPRIDIITGTSDAPSWRWSERLGKIVKQNENVRIIELQGFRNPAKTHGLLQDLSCEGTWKVITGRGSELVEGNLEGMLNRPVKGVSMEMDVSDESFSRQTDGKLDSLRDRILKRKP